MPTHWRHDKPTGSGHEARVRAEGAARRGPAMTRVYFSNGSEFMRFDERCCHCLNYERRNGYDCGCRLGIYDFIIENSYRNYDRDENGHCGIEMPDDQMSG